ncbi:MAG: hypothetical protein JSW27_08595, partial [Phycisphaerales bacterium]
LGRAASNWLLAVRPLHTPELLRGESIYLKKTGPEYIKSSELSSFPKVSHMDSPMEQTGSKQ